MSVSKQKTGGYKRYTRSKFGNIVYFFMLVLMGLFTLLPIVYMIVTSLKPLDELLIFPPRFFVNRPTLSNFIQLPQLLSNLNVPLSRYLFNSLFIAVAVTILQMFFGSSCAFVLSKVKLKFVKIFFAITQLSLLYNAYTLAIPRYIIYVELGMINTYWLYILPSLASSLTVFLIKQYIDDGIPDALLEAAKIDGANLFTIYWRIIMPNIKPALMTVCLYGFQGIWSLQSDGAIFDEVLKTLPSVLTQISSGGLARAGSAMAASVLMMVPVVLVYVISQSSVMETMSSAGMKD